MEFRRFKILAALSNIDWIGKKVVGGHYGTIALKEGSLQIENNKILAGNFIADTRSIKVLDVISPVAREQLTAHLASDDFFSSEEHPEAALGINSAETLGLGHYLISGDLTIKGITRPIVFATHVRISEDVLVATAKMTVDRIQYGMKFRSGNFFKDLGDNLIYNDFDLNIHITAKGQS